MIDIKTKKIRFWDYVLLFICFFLTFKQLNVFFPQLFTVGFLLVGCLVLLYFVKVRPRNESVIWIAFYTIILALNFMSGDSYFDSIGDVIQEIVILFFTSTLTCYIFDVKHVKLAKFLVFITLAIIVYYGISSYRIEQVTPGVIRNTVYMTNVGELNYVHFFYMRGLATYQFPHALPILIPPLMMGIRDRSQKKWLKLFYGIALFAIFVLTFISYAATALFLSILILIITFFIQHGSVKDNIAKIVVIGIIFLPIIFSPGFFLQPLSDLFSSAEDASYIDKLVDIQKLTDSGASTGSVAARESKYEITLNEIIDNPILGTNKRTGDHSAILDRWACLGLVGWIPYIGFLVCQFKVLKRRISKEVRPYFVVGVLAALIMLFAKNMSNWETWFMVFTMLPLMIWLQSQKTIKR